MKEAVPTEYEGTVFRSKSEAIFARNLDLAFLPWRYENERYVQNDGWVPDFLIYWGDSTVVVEYKPRLPNPTYIQRLIPRFEKCFRDMGDIDPESKHGFVVAASPWTPPYEWKTLMFIDGSVYKEYSFPSRFDDITDSQHLGRLHRKLTSHIVSAKDYRFDL